MAKHAEAKAVAVIAVAAGGSERVNRNQHARPGNISGVDGIAQPNVDEIGRADIAHRGEAGHHGLARVRGGANRFLGNRPLQGEQRIAVVIGVELIGQMRMRVDETGKQRGIAQIDDRRARRRVRAANGLNHAV